MIDPCNETIVAERRTADGRIVRFTVAGVRDQWPVPWSGVVCDTGSERQGFLVRLDDHAAPEGWTARQLLEVVRRRLAEEAARCPFPAAIEAAAALELASIFRLERRAEAANAGHGMSFVTGPKPSPFTWTVVRRDGHELALCSDPEGRGAGLTPEQLLIVLDQLMHEAHEATHLPGLGQVRAHIATALAAEMRRLAFIRN